MRHSHACSDALPPDSDPAWSNATGRPANDPEFNTGLQPQVCAVAPEWPTRGPVHRFEENAHWHGYRTAVLYADQRLDYAALNQYANRLAWALQHLASTNGATGSTRTKTVTHTSSSNPDSPPTWLLYLEHSHHLLAAMLACMKIGHTFIVLNPDWSGPQLRSQLLQAARDRSPMAALTMGRHRLALQSTGQQVIDLQGSFAHRWPLHNPQQALAADSPMCLVPANTAQRHPASQALSWQALSPRDGHEAARAFERGQQLTSRSRRALREHAYDSQLLIESLAILSTGGSLTMSLTDICAESLWPAATSV